MSQSTSKPRYVVREKPSKSGRGRWCVVDRIRRKVDSRYVYEPSARMVADSLNDLDRDLRAGDAWPTEAYTDRWTLVPPVEPAERSEADEVAPSDREWWAREADGALEDRARIEALEEAHAFDAWLDTLEAEYHAREPEEQELAEMGILPRRQPTW